MPSRLSIWQQLRCVGKEVRLEVEAVLLRTRLEETDLLESSMGSVDMFVLPAPYPFEAQHRITLRPETNWKCSVVAMRG